jgi:hypothetical protein
MDWAIELRFQGLCATLCLRFHGVFFFFGLLSFQRSSGESGFDGEIRDIFLQISRDTQ